MKSCYIRRGDEKMWFNKKKWFSKTPRLRGRANRKVPARAGSSPGDQTDLVAPVDTDATNLLNLLESRASVKEVFQALLMAQAQAQAGNKITLSMHEFEQSVTHPLL